MGFRIFIINNNLITRYEVFTPVAVQIFVFWVATLYNPVYILKEHVAPFFRVEVCRVRNWLLYRHTRCIRKFPD
jgi:hypothetical protein